VLTTFRGKLSLVVGSRLALERGRGARAVPVRAGILGIVAGIAGLIAVTVVDASVLRVISTPLRYGTGYQFEAMRRGAPPSATEDLGQELASDSNVAAVTLAIVGDVFVGGDRRTQAWGIESLKGEQLFTLLDGRLPAAPDEVALGIDTNPRGAERKGGVVEVAGPGGTKSYRVVGRVLFPASQVEAFADGVLLTRSGMEQLGAGQGASLLGRWAPHSDRDVVEARLRASGVALVAPRRPPQIANLEEVTPVVRLLAGFLGLLVAIALAHTVASTLRRRGHDLALLRVLGFERMQVRAAVSWHVTVLIGLGSMIGIPLGLVLGRSVWARLADDLHVARDPSVPATVAFVPLLLATIGLAVALAVAGRALRRRPAAVLRAL
jgi:hypothetical protein